MSMNIVWICVSKTESMKNFRVCLSPLVDPSDTSSYDPMNCCTIRPSSKREFNAFKIGKTYPMQRIKT